MSLTNALSLLVSLMSFWLPIPHQQQPAPTSRTSSGAVSGVVLDGKGKPLAGATVYGMPEIDMRKQFPTESNSAGEFTLSGLPEGLVYLSAFKESDGYPYDFYSFFALPGENTPLKLQIRAGEELRNVHIQLGERAARLNLKITTDDGKPFEGDASLSFTRPDQPGRPYSRAARTTESLLVPPVPFHIAVEAAGFKTWRYTGNKSGLINLKSGETLDLSVRLEKLR